MTSMDVDLEHRGEQAEEHRPRPDLLLRQFLESRERLVPGPGHVEGVRELGEQRPLTRAVAEPACELERGLKVAERLCVAVTPERGVREVHVRERRPLGKVMLDCDRECLCKKRSPLLRMTLGFRDARLRV